MYNSGSIPVLKARARLFLIGGIWEQFDRQIIFGLLYMEEEIL
jgi:hypothetical protein